MKLGTIAGDDAAEPLDLAALVAQVAAARAPTLPPAVQLVVDVAASLSNIHGVRTELERLVSSLLELWLAAAATTGGVVLIVGGTDDGAGIRLEVLSTSAATPLPVLPPRLDHGDSLRLILTVVGRHDATLRVSTSATGTTRLEIVFPCVRANDRAARCRRPTQPLLRATVRSIH
ncbi:MAG: hypothetical protein IPQ07_23150 [Myxococcales bacterium]|nr:hypothetical protein [Myxococcales bacterium]